MNARTRRLGLALLMLAGFTARGHADPLVIDHTCIDTHDNVIPMNALERARRLRVVLGHESVGFNVVQGLEGLSQQSPRYRLDIGHMIQAWWYTQHAGLGEWFVGNANNVPGKAQAFEQRLASGVGNAVQVASLKLCFADLQRNSDTDANFDAYVDVMERMQRQYPRVKFVYWSMPMRREAVLQQKRTHFNQRMAAYLKQHEVVLFDIADIECHKPDGTAFHNETGELAMWDGYTVDGGHLNDVGKARAARAWWWLTARLAGWEGPAVR
ncbi:MAG: SGNH/GDSL hydrolase family protein [Armatimonadetes bacterium]|nr:SGNH/GDSL hydrolase family protein [Armatimonadota bacterium]